MLTESLIVSAVLLVMLNVTAFWKSVLAALPWCFFSLVGLGFCMVVLPALLLQGALSLAAGLVCLWLAPRPRPFLAATVAAFLAAYAVMGVEAWLSLDRLRRENVPVSMSERLAYENRAVAPVASPELPPDVRFVFLREADSPNSYLDEHQSTRRAEALKVLHERQVTAFAESPGFGVTRGPGPITRRLYLPEEPILPLAQVENAIPPESAATLPLLGGEATLDEAGGETLRSLHDSSVLDFAFPEGFGYVKDREHVYGFRPHRFSESPARNLKSTAWRFRRLELVSLLKHERPAVYVSKNLPRMSELRRARTRPLDSFEAAALPRLAADDLVIHATPDRLRVLGAVRAGEACVECHSVEKGALLGAFSYLLDRAGQ